VYRISRCMHQRTWGISCNIIIIIIIIITIIIIVWFLEVSPWFPDHGVRIGRKCDFTLEVSWTQIGSRDIGEVFFVLSSRSLVKPRLGRFTRGTTRYPLYKKRLGRPPGQSGRVREIFRPTGISFLDGPFRAVSLYRLSYPVHIPFRRIC
jgi:hypothetical protein